MRAADTDTQINKIARMRRSPLIRGILTIDCTFPIDFTRDYLESLDLEKLRHIYLALCLHKRSAPRGSARRAKK